MVPSGCVARRAMAGGCRAAARLRRPPVRLLFTV